MTAPGEWDYLLAGGESCKHRADDLSLADPRRTPYAYKRRMTGPDGLERALEGRRLTSPDAEAYRRSGAERSRGMVSWGSCAIERVQYVDQPRPARRVGREEARDQAVQGERKSRNDRAQRAEGRTPVLPGHSLPVFEGHPSGNELVNDHAQRIPIHRGADRTTPGLLGRHVDERTRDVRWQLGRFSSQRDPQPEVQQHHAPGAIHHDIRRLDVAMKLAGRV